MGGPGDAKEERTDATDIAGGDASQMVLKKGPWTTAEDAILIEYVSKHGEGNWNAVQKNSGLQRCGKSCRLRWANHLRPNLKKGSFSSEEEMLILQLHAEFGNKWARMAAHLPGRTDNEIKNYWNTRIKRRQRAGLPLYPSEIHQRMALRGIRKEQHMPWKGASPSVLKPSPTPFSLFTPATPPVSQYSYGSVHQNPSPGKNHSFQLINFANPIQYGLGNFDLGPPLQIRNTQPSFPVKMELPSSQFSSNSGVEQISPGNSGLLDALFQDSRKASEMPSLKCQNLDSLGKLGYPDFSLGIQVKQESVETANPNASMLLDMIPKQMAMPSPMTVLSDWMNNSNSGGDISGGPSPAATAADEDIELDMPHIPPEEHDWGSWDGIHWDTMPRIY